MLLAHGAGADLNHVHMQTIAENLAEVGVATLRFNFPYMQAGKKRTDAIPVCMAAIDSALRHLSTLDQSRPILLGGHSFGGRMMSHYAATHLGEADAPVGSVRVKGLVYFSFPLHPSGKPDTKRAMHMPAIPLPQIFLSGTRDKLAEPELLRETISKLQDARIHWLETADHGFKILKRTRTDPENVYHESARVIQNWLS